MTQLRRLQRDARETLLQEADGDIMPDPAPASPVAARLTNVSVAFAAAGSKGPAKRVLDDVSISIASSEFVVLIGRSGCGKTTLLNLLAGLVKPSGGSVDIYPDNTHGVHAPTLGYMQARDALLPWRSAVKNVEFGLEVHKVPRQERRPRALEYLESLGLDHVAHAYPAQLSQGMRQRVALARTWAIEPDIVLMDEPFAALDAQTRTSVQDTFLQIWERYRKTVVFVTHDLLEAIVLADRIVVLGEGGSIIDDLRVPFARPRSSVKLSATVEFRALQERLWKLIA